MIMRQVSKEISLWKLSSFKIEERTDLKEKKTIRASLIWKLFELSFEELANKSLPPN